jgi:hypothetical protein
MTRGASAGTVFLARTDARGMNACPQSARVAKWQPQRTQNPPPSKGMKVRVLSRALAATIAGEAQATPATLRSARPGDNAGERRRQHEREDEQRRAAAIRKSFLIRKSATRNPDRAIDAILAYVDRRSRTSGGQRGTGLREIDPKEFPERDDFAEAEETHRRNARGDSACRKPRPTRPESGAFYDTLPSTADLLLLAPPP